MKALDEQFVELDSEMSEHVAKANHYGNKWTEQMDKAGLVVKDRVIKTTIKWFKNLTTDELRKSYKNIWQGFFMDIEIRDFPDDF